MAEALLNRLQLRSVSRTQPKKTPGLNSESNERELILNEAKLTSQQWFQSQPAHPMVIL